MKKYVTIFLTFLLMTTTCSSQVISNGTAKDSTVLITSGQIKKANLIFAEHRKLLEENQLLYKQLENYKEDNKSLIKMDSLRKQQIENFELLSKSHETRINILNNKINKKERTLRVWKIGGITVSAGLLLVVLLK